MSWTKSLSPSTEIKRDKIKEKEAALVKLERQNSELAERLARIEALLASPKTPKQ